MNKSDPNGHSAWGDSIKEAWNDFLSSFSGGVANTRSNSSGSSDNSSSNSMFADSGSVNSSTSTNSAGVKTSGATAGQEQEKKKLLAMKAGIGGDGRPLTMIIDHQESALGLYANGTSSSFTYSATRQWLTDVITTGPNGLLQDVSYTRSNTGRIDQIDGSSTTLKDKWIYEYDELDQLLSAQNLEDPFLDQTFEYDVLGSEEWSRRVVAKRSNN